MTPDELEALANLARQLRVDSIRCTTAVGAGHPTSSLSAADLLAVLVDAPPPLRLVGAEAARERPPHLLEGSRLAAALLGVPGRRRRRARTSSSRPTAASARACRATRPRCCRGSTSPPARSASASPRPSASRSPASTSTSSPTGSGCSAATARSPRARSGRPSTRPRYYELDNFTAIVDVNRLGQRGPTELGWDLDAYAARVAAFGCHAIEIDGHDLEAIDAAFGEAAARRAPDA